MKLAKSFRTVSNELPNNSKTNRKNGIRNRMVRHFPRLVSSLHAYVWNHNLCWRRFRQRQSLGVYRLVVPSAAARTVHDSGPDGPWPGRRSSAFSTWHRALARTVRDGVRSSSSSLESRTRPLVRDLRVLRVDRKPGASPDDVESYRN
jgi:hypothetical protein